MVALVCMVLCGGSVHSTAPHASPSSPLITSHPQDQQDLLDPVVGAIQPNYLGNDDSLSLLPDGGAPTGEDDHGSDPTTTAATTSQKKKNRKRGRKNNPAGKDKALHRDEGDEEFPDVVSDADLIDGALDEETNVTVAGGNETEGEKKLVARIPYTRAPVNNSFAARDSFSARGMEHLYFIVDLFMDLIHREEEMPAVLGK